MIRYLMFSLLLASAAGATSSDREERQCHERVEICHKDKHVIVVDEHAVDAHLAHGDCLGECPCSAPPECVSDTDCSNDLFCDGVEVCLDGVCGSGPTSCLTDETCLEDTDTCVPPPECRADSDCSDGVFCNGEEVCSTGSCTTLNLDACPNLLCLEEQDICVVPPECTQDSDCSNGLFCDGHELCQEGFCTTTVLPCPDGEGCDEELDACFASEGEGEGEPSEGEGESSEGEGEGEPSEGEGEPSEGEGESSEGEGEGEPSEGEGEPSEGEGEPSRGPVSGSDEELFISGSGVFACSAGGTGGSWAMLAALFALLALRNRRVVAPLFFAAIMVSTASNAEGLNRVTGPMSTNDTAQAASADTLPELKLQTSVGLDYAHAPITLRDESFAKDSNLIDHQFTGRVNAAFGLTDRVQFDASLPVALTMGQGILLDGTPSAGLQDVMGGVRLRLTEPNSALRAALVARTTMPSGFLAFNGNPVLGEQLPTITPGILVSAGNDDASVLFDAGYTLRVPKSVGDLTIGHTVNASVGGRVNLIEERLWAVADVSGAFSAQPLLSNRVFLPIEATAGLIGQNGPLHGMVVIGSGLLPDVGTPTVRAMAFVGFDFDFKPHGQPVTTAQNVEPTPATPPLPADTDGDGVIDTEDECPLVPEDFDAFEDDDGCPEEQKVIVKPDRIVLIEPVYFFYDSDKIKPESSDVLDDVATVLSEHREISLLLVAGHASSEGKRAYNQKLSSLRAAAVVKQLVARGVDSSRLNSAGFGEDQPVASNGTRAGREKNRRVEFLILDSK